MATSFNMANFIESVEMPTWLSHNSAWYGHIPMTAVLMKLLRPGQFVELGTFRGDSYMAFCQAVKRLELPTRCTAVDTWKGDTHAGFYPAAVLEHLKAAHDPVYGSFSRLLQATFAEALPTFADGSIDLLHVDGHHTYEAVREDFETWLPKVSTRGVILFHDTMVREKDFGVWRLWEEISARYPSFNVPYSCGLGILAVGDEVPRGMLEFLGELRDFSQVILPQFLAMAGRIEVTRKMMGVVNDLQGGQAVLNEWRKLRGQPVTGLTGAAAWENPGGLAANVAMNVREVVAESVELLRENQRLRERATARIGVVKEVVQAAVVAQTAV